MPTKFYISVDEEGKETKFDNLDSLVSHIINNGKEDFYQLIGIAFALKWEIETCNSIDELRLHSSNKALVNFLCDRYELARQHK